MLYVEKDDPREAPESGDKKPQPVKNSPFIRFPPPALLVAYCLGETLTAIQMVQQRAEMPNDTTKIKN
ncbi:hypothetical protein ACX5DB_000769 [Enterobacter ludwigii]